MVVEGHCKGENVEAFIFCGMVDSEGIVVRVWREGLRGAEEGCIKLQK